MVSKVISKISPSTIVVSETVIVSLMQFATFAVMLRLTNSEIVGLWLLINSILAISRAADFWSNGVSSFVAQARGQEKLFRASSLTVTAILTASLGYAVLAIIGYIVIVNFSDQLIGLEYSETVNSILPVMTLTFWMLGLNGAISLCFLGYERPGIKAALSISGNGMFLLLVSILASNFALWGIILAQAIQATVMLVVSGFLSYVTLVRPDGGVFKKCLAIEMIKYGTKALTLGLFQISFEPISRILVNAFGGLTAVTLFDLASRFMGVGRGIITSLGQILVPRFASIVSSEPNIQSLLSYSQEKFLLLGGISFSLTIAASPLLSIIMLSEVNQIFLVMTVALSFGWLTTILVTPMYFLLIGKRILGPLIISNVTKTSGALVLGWSGGVFFGLNGAVIGISLALLISSVQLYLTTKPNVGKHITLDFQSVRVLLILIFSVISCAIALYYSDLDKTRNVLIWVSFAPLLATISLAVTIIPLKGVLETFSNSYGIKR